jgi:AAA family ATP:ADP antiporter
MLTVVERILGLTARELGRATPLFLYLFLAMAGSVASKAARDALFLDRFSATQLPYVDIAIALIVGVVAGVYIRVGSRTTLRNVQIGSLLAFAGSAVLFWTLATRGRGGSDVLFVVIYVWVGVLSVIVPTQVWTLANYILTTREAKRAFGFIGSGAILGWIVGGLATRALATRFGAESTLLWVGATLGISAPLVWGIWRDRRGADEPDVAPPAPEGRGGLADSLSLMRESSYLTAIAAVIWLAAFVTTIAGWQFKAIAKENIPDTDQLAMFFGTFNVAGGVLALVLQVLFTGRVLRSAGIGVTLFIVPVALSISSVALLMIGSLTAVIALKASDQILRYSIDKATIELLYLPVPGLVVFRVKSFIDTVVYRFGDALGGVAVLLLASVIGLSAVQITWLVLAALGAWFWAAAVARRQYVENLRESIHQHRVDTERANAPVLEKSAFDLIALQLQGTPEKIIYALSLLEMSHDREVHPAVRDLLTHESAEVRMQAVRVLARSGDASLVGDIERLLYDPHLEVRTEALLFLTKHAHVDPLERIEQLGDFPDFSLRAAMAAFLAREGPTQNLEAARAIIGAMVNESGDPGQRTRLEAAQVLSVIPDGFDRELRLLLQDPDTSVTAAAVRAVGRHRKRVLVGRVIERIAERGITEAAVTALAGFGDGIVGTLRDVLVDTDSPAQIRREIPAVLQEIGTPAAQFVLLESVLVSDTVIRHRIITALNKLGQMYPERRIDRRLIETVLGAEVMSHYRTYQVLGTLGASFDDERDPVVSGLKDSIQQEAERIFRLLKILHPEYDMHSAYVGLRAEDPAVHDNAVEFLDAILSPQMRTLLLPLFDRDVSIRQRAHMANQILGSSLGDREEAIEVMMLSHDPWLRSCAAYAIGEFKLTRFSTKLDEWAGDADPLLRSTASQARQKLRTA